MCPSPSDFYDYRPQRSCKGYVLQVSVCLKGEGCLPFWCPGGSPILVSRGSPILVSRGVFHFGVWGSPILVPGGLPFSCPGGSPILVPGGSLILVSGASRGPQPRGKLRGIRSRPTAKGEIEGDLVQAHSQGGSSGNQKQTTSPPPGRLPLLRTVRILLECILVFM